MHVNNTEKNIRKYAVPCPMALKQPQANNSDMAKAKQLM